MLRIRHIHKPLLNNLLLCRYLHQTCNFLDVNKAKPQPTIAKKRFENEQPLSSIEEENLFQNVLSEIQEKFGSRVENAKDIAAMLPNTDESSSVLASSRFNSTPKGQIQRSQQAIEFDRQDKKLLEFFKGKLEKKIKVQESDKSSIPILQSQNETLKKEMTYLENKNELSAKSLDELAISYTERTLPLEDLNLDRVKFEKLKGKERYKVAMDNIMVPYIEYLRTSLGTDYAVLDCVKKLIEKYLINGDTISNEDEHDGTNEKLGQLEPLEIIEMVTQNLEVSSNELPQPYRITIPYVLTKLLDPEFMPLPEDRRYQIISYIYKECKRSSDVTLYLNVCTVELYNILLDLSWKNFYEVKKLKTIITEMTINGVSGDIYTLEILENAVKGMRTMNSDDIDDLYDGIPLHQETTKKEPLTVSVVWSRETTTDLHFIDNYIRQLKQDITS
ncbi:Mtf2p NDAI_0A06730 [Naumovozyma dairenensis CBS 421]|uniref:Mtf2-like C-terminal domain-containing protein n=1 Tax=Naumovozyma dairenensis (strain ATCC 10597 / BCRC 20456 / CBS 421 / NBRC 0211 / NRRL Y-12639) TaxID=1071378 RepID=G0W4T9_NAUDC|nr:hypothetical protein NDAI_0A06730 [Naumovozyma dairenensis CBS 421]CCD22827.1 hypothetical protein NDAI_0A06730 [Naumovozyma dairenensis CBS 421]